MAITRKEAFKAGFLLKCAELGLTPSEVYAHLTKKAGPMELGEKFVGGAFDTLKDVIAPVAKTALIWAPITAGATGALIASQATSPSRVDLDAARQKLKIMQIREAVQEISQRRLLNKRLKTEYGN